MNRVLGYNVFFSFPYLGLNHKILKTSCNIKNSSQHIYSIFEVPKVQNANQYPKFNTLAWLYKAVMNRRS